MRMIFAGIVAALAGFASTVHAATLVAINGQILVNRGSGFEIAQPGLELKPGDLIVANPGATAQIMYPEGCLLPVVPGQISSVVRQAPCQPVTTGSVRTPAANQPAATAQQRRDQSLDPSSPPFEGRAAQASP